jgi:transcriptional regulator with XRE-family HTH domain
MVKTRQYAANRIRQLRQARGYSLEALGAAMPSRLTPSTVSKLEKGAMALSADYILEIAAVLGVSPLEVLMDDSAESSHFVPIIPREHIQAYFGGNFSSMEVVAIPASIAKPHLFAIPVEPGEAPGLLASGFVVADPQRCTLEDEAWFIIVGAEGGTDFARFTASPPSFCFASAGADALPEPLGTRPFTVLGRVVYAGQIIP